MAVDWTTAQRFPFRRVFLEGVDGVVRPDVAAAKRAPLNIQVESDPAGVDRTPAPIDRFSELAVLPPWIHEALTENGWDIPMPVQAQALPILLSGRNLIGIAQTGSGKTGAFLLPAIVHANDQWPLSRSNPGPIVLVLSPTRELAVQISDEADKLLRYSSNSREHQGGLRSVCFYGGGRKFEQLRKFTYDGSHIAVATPGRLIDFCKEGKVSLQRVTYFCLDEADRMLDMGFSGEMDEISRAIRPERQTVFFSATWPKEVQQLAYKLCTDTPVTIRVGRSGGGGGAAAGAGDGGEEGNGLLAREGIEQQVVVVDFPEERRPWDKQNEVKKKLLSEHVKQVMEDKEAKMLIFVNQKSFADELSEQFWNEGIHVDALHGGRPQEKRLEILESFRKGDTNLLIATDVIGRGLDIPKISHVVVYSMNGVEDYIHRIGRTGRGKDGKGHALVFFEHAPNFPDGAKELIDVLRRSMQPVTRELQKIAEDVASGKRQSNSSWGGSSWGSRGSYKDSSKWADWNSKDWKDRSSDGAKPETLADKLSR